MSSASVQLRPVIPWRMRADLIVRRQERGGWTVKDPIHLRYFQLAEIEMAVLSLLDGRASPSAIPAEIERIVPGGNVTTRDLDDLLGQFVQNRLVLPTNVASAEAPTDKGPSFRSSGVGTLFRRLASVLSFRVRLLDPSPVLEFLSPALRIVFSFRGAALITILIVAAAMLSATHFQEFVRELPGPYEFFGVDNMLLLLVSFVAVKALHELGHAAAAKHFGAECHEAGLIMILFTPLLYTNVSDSWMLNRSKRLLITASGILVEVTLAAVCMILWTNAAPGLTRSLLANTIVLCSVSTLAFNANPLARFDGYFLLSDLVRRPNLAQQADSAVPQLLVRALLGAGPSRSSHSTTLSSLSDQQPEDALSRNRPAAFVLVYGMMSAIYRFVLGVTIVLFLVTLFDRHGLSIVGFVLATVATAAFLLRPARRFVSGLLFDLLQRPNRISSTVRLFSVVGAISLLSFIPLPQSITIPATVEPAGTSVFATLTGQFVRGANYGSEVNHKDIIAELTDPGLRRRELMLMEDVRQKEIQVRGLELRRDTQPQANLPEARKSLNAAQMRLEQFQKELQRLSIRSTSDGMFMPPRALNSDAFDDDTVLQAWTGFPVYDANAGARFEAGTLLGHVSHVRELELRACLTEDQMQLVRRNSAAAFQQNGNPASVLPGRVAQLSQIDSGEIPAELAAAGLAAPLQQGLNRQPQPTWTASVRLTVPETHANPPLYSTGLVRIRVEPISIAARIRRYLVRTFGS